jgi:beta-lactam-binding protein with PASTA domain
LIGLTLARAKARLRTRHCKVGRVTRRVTSRRPGRVIAQNPRAGAVRRAGFKVRLVVGRR